MGNYLKRYLSLLRSLYRSNLRRADAPRLLTYIVTFSCNARCVMCDSWRKAPERELSLAEIERIFSQLPEMDAVRLSGGEPFVRKDLQEIVSLVDRQLKPLVLHVTTNGFLTDRIVELCEKRDRELPLQLLVSIDGVGAKHDEVRGIGRAWDRAMDTVRTLAPRQRSLNLKVAVNQTVVDGTGLEQYRQLRDILSPLGVKNQLVIAYEESATYSLERNRCVAPRYPGELRTFGQFSREELEALFAEALKDVATYPWPLRAAKRYYLEGARRRLLEGEPSPNPACVALSSHMRLFPDGTVPTCQFNTQPVGSLRDTDFATLWRSTRAEELRSWVSACPGCWAECEVLPSAVYTGDLARHAIRRLPLLSR